MRPETPMGARRRQKMSRLGDWSQWNVIKVISINLPTQLLKYSTYQLVIWSLSRRRNIQRALWSWVWAVPVLSRFGKPWAESSTLERKTLGKKSHVFASETPWNDQIFSLSGSLSRQQYCLQMLKLFIKTKQVPGVLGCLVHQAA